MKDGGRMTFVPDLMSSGLMAVVKFTQLTIRTISGREAMSQIAAIPV